MNKIVHAGDIEIFTSGDYCNVCKFRRYMNNDIKYICLLFGGRISRDGNNFKRLEICKTREVGDV